MQSFDDIPVNEIDHFLISNGLPLLGDKCSTISKFLLTNAVKEIPVSIFIWFINSHSDENK